jgi:hypothetical protein
LNTPLPPPPAPGPETERVLDAASRGDHSCYYQVLALINDADRGLALIDGVGNLANTVKNQLLDKAVGKNLVLSAAIMARMNDMQDALHGPDPSALEVVMIERVAVCWLEMYLAQLSASELAGLNIPQADWRQRNLTAASGRFTSACVALARVQRLAKPRIKSIVQIAANGPTQVTLA